MPKLDSFSLEIVKAVRAMSDDALLALVRAQLSGVIAPLSAAAAAVATSAEAAPAPKGRRGGRRAGKRAGKKAAKIVKIVKAAAPAKPAKPAKKAARKVAKRVGRGRGVGAEAKQRALELVEKTVKASKGLAVSDIATQTGLPGSRVTAAVRELKATKRIHQGGDRRFARYAGDPKTAKAASEHARTHASGPKRPK